MRLLILDAYNTLNYGSMMMLENFVLYFTKHSQRTDVEFVVPSQVLHESRERLDGALGEYADTIHLVDLPTLPRRRLYRLRRLGSLARGNSRTTLLKEVAERCDAVVVLGGDGYTEDYNYLRALEHLLELRALRHMGLPVVMCGQTIGPFHSWRQPLARRLLACMSAIVARDPITYSYLSETLGLTNVLEGADLALLPLARETVAREAVSDGRYVTLVPSELIWRYEGTRDRAGYVKNMSALCQAIMRRLPDHRIVILPHVLAPPHVDDRRVAKEIMTLLHEDVDISGITALAAPMLPYQARAILQGSRLVVAGRMHAAISALAGGTPSISMAYSRKYHGIIGHQFGLDRFIVDVREGSWSEIRGKVLKSMDELLENEADVRAGLKERLQSARERALRNVTAVVETVR